MSISRRDFLQKAAGLSALPALFAFTDKLSSNSQYRIGACDWSIGKSSDPAAFDVAKSIGLQGLMVNMGSKQNGMHLRNKEMQQQYLDASKRSGVAISSLAIGELNNYPYKSDPDTEAWVHDSIFVANNLGVNVVLLAFFSKNDLRNDEAGMKEVIRRLKAVAPIAEKNKVILGIESYLDAAGHLKIMDAVGSKSIKVYMDFRNTADAGYDVYKEVRLIGSDNICELHMKENGSLLGQGTLNWEEIRNLLDEINYKGNGWMQIESSTPKEGNVVDHYQHNLKFLRKVFADKI